MKILCYGSLNIDYVYDVDHIVLEGETIGSSSLETFPGGKGLNQSIALARSGLKSVYHAGKIGHDGSMLLDTLKQSNVNTDNISVSDTKTGNAIIQRDVKGENSIILYQGANYENLTDTMHDTICKFSKGDFLVLQNEVNDLKTLINLGCKRGMIVVLNPSPIDNTLKSMDLKKVDYLILNEIEAKELLDLNVDEMYSPDFLIEGLRSKYNQTKIVVTLGDRGSIYKDDYIEIVQESYETNPVDTTGAGDTFSGYFISGIIKNLPMEEVMRDASKAASISVSRLGAASSIPYYEEVKSFGVNDKAGDI